MKKLYRVEFEVYLSADSVNDAAVAALAELRVQGDFVNCYVREVEEDTGAVALPFVKVVLT